MVNPSSILDEIIEISLNRQKPPLFLAEDRKREYTGFVAFKGQSFNPTNPCAHHSLAHTARNKQENKTKAA